MRYQSTEALTRKVEAFNQLSAMAHRAHSGMIEALNGREGTKVKLADGRLIQPLREAFHRIRSAEFNGWPNRMAVGLRMWLDVSEYSLWLYCTSDVYDVRYKGHREELKIDRRVANFDGNLLSSTYPWDDPKKFDPTDVAATLARLDQLRDELAQLESDYYWFK